VEAMLIPKVGAAVLVFASTNLDDLFVLIALFAEARLRASHIVLGQCAGFAVLLGLSLAASRASAWIPGPWFGLLGLVPIVVGLRRLIAMGIPEKPDARQELRWMGRHVPVLAVGAITVANGGDNLCVYTPLFAASPVPEIIVTSAVFGAMTAAWLGMAHFLVNHRLLSARIRPLARVVAPVALVCVGLVVLARAGTWDYLWH
jgi:cadmium resistance protein CadD (predicted permease)